MTDGATIIYILYGAGVLGLARVRGVAQDIVHRWQAWQRGRMTAWQRRVLYQEEPPPGSRWSRLSRS